jgi:hypothetical protein
MVPSAPMNPGLSKIVDEQHHRMEVRFQSHAFDFDDLRGFPR